MSLQIINHLLYKKTGVWFTKSKGAISETSLCCAGAAKESRLRDSNYAAWKSTWPFLRHLNPKMTIKKTRLDWALASYFFFSAFWVNSKNSCSRAVCFPDSFLPLPGIMTVAAFLSVFRRSLQSRKSWRTGLSKNKDWENKFQTFRKVCFFRETHVFCPEKLDLELNRENRSANNLFGTFFDLRMLHSLPCFLNSKVPIPWKRLKSVQCCYFW